MVLTVGNDDDGLAYLLLLGEAVGSHLYSPRYVRALRGHQRRVDVRQEHLGRHIVTGDGQLHKGIACKHNEAYLVVRKVVDQVLDHHLRTVQTAGRHILGQHGVTDVDTNDGLNACALLVTDFRSHLRTGKHQDEQGQSGLQQPELHSRTPARHVGHQLLQQPGVAKLAQALLLVTIGQKPDDGQYGNQQQQVQV